MAWFKSYEHFHSKNLTGHNDNSADPMAVYSFIFVTRTNLEIVCIDWLCLLTTEIIRFDKRSIDIVYFVKKPEQSVQFKHLVSF